MLQMVPEKSISTELIDNVLDFIGALSSTVRNVRHSFEVAADLTPQELMVMAELSQHGPMPVKDIVSRLVGISPSTLTRVLDKLEENGMVTRALNPTDRRSFRVSLTERGAQTVAEYTDQLESVVRQMLFPLTPAERMMLAELQATMVSALQDDGGRPAPEVAA